MNNPAADFPQNTTPPTDAVYSRLMVDGNTELRVRGWTRDHMSTRLRGLLRTVDENIDDEPRLIVAARPWVGSPKPGDREALPVSRAWRTGKPRAYVYHVEVPGAFHLTLNERHSTVTVQLAASMLWSVGYAAAVSWTLRALHAEIFWELNDGHSGRVHMLRPDTPLETAAAAGWRVRRLELCTDFADYSIDSSSVHLGFKSKPVLFGVDPEAGKAETIAIGGLSSAVRLRVYDKREECNSGGEDSTWKYAEVWKRNGWTPGAPVYRVELVIQEDGLTIEGKDGAAFLDMTDPAALADPQALAQVWKFHATRKRRIMGGSATRRERSDTHPDWQRVIDAADKATEFVPLDHRQRRAAMAGACDTMAERDAAVTANAALRFAARELGISSTLQYADGQCTVDGVAVPHPGETANATRLAIQLGLEAMVASLDHVTLLKKSAYIASYHASKETELGEEMAERAARYVYPPGSVEAWAARSTHTPRVP
jgi:hypothetical protein